MTARITATAYPTPLVPPIFPPDMVALNLTSTTWPDGGTIPFSCVAKGYGSSTEDGNDVSPQVSWDKGPAGTAGYVVTIFDTDAPTGVGFWHWLVFNIPPTVTSLAQDASRNLPAGIVQGRGDAGVSAYYGPAPPAGDRPHHYYITVSALDKMIPSNFGPTTGGALLAFLMSEAVKVLARGQYMGEYGR
ncbi:MAG: YbhB/YbcL family Raf kinase inhibitor-like protein [Candidatus Eremiobacteraeota bacterium]|nr:YbhB/YbcL family Raf kinase inhibitor-like protein [Candidatus Eremiobacteraeota bacterium]MBV8374816.1 YbhB/YbcL family Raf kinase inhibitor-like protein [Candidatus Eremiobacteraeota bacterium]